MVQYIGFSRKIAGNKPNKIPNLWKGYASMDGNFMGVFACDLNLEDSKGGISKRASGTFAPTRLDGSNYKQSETTRAGKQYLSANPPGYATSEQAPLQRPQSFVCGLSIRRCSSFSPRSSASRGPHFFCLRGKHIRALPVADEARFDFVRNR